VSGFAAFDPDEKYHTLDVVKCEVIMKDTLGAIVAKVRDSSVYMLIISLF
jgi:hypothetical protein